MIFVSNKDGGCKISSLEEVLNNINGYIQYRLPELTFVECNKLTDMLCKDLDSQLKSYSDSLKETKKVALELSEYDDILYFLLNNISEETLNRVKSIDWEKLSKDSGHYRKDINERIYDTCSGRSPMEIKEELKNAAVKNNPDEFIKSLNELLGNCCISSINDLDDV
jgi:hypothetical protein